MRVRLDDVVYEHDDKWQEIVSEDGVKAMVLTADAAYDANSEERIPFTEIGRTGIDRYNALEQFIFAVMQDGRGIIFSYSNVSTLRRGGHGLPLVSEGGPAATVIVRIVDDVQIITANAMSIRIPVSSLRIGPRGGYPTRIFNIPEDDYVVSCAAITGYKLADPVWGKKPTETTAPM